MPRIRRTARMTSVVKDTSAPAEDSSSESDASSKSSESSEEAESRGDVDPPVDRGSGKQFPPGKKYLLRPPLIEDKHDSDDDKVEKPSSEAWSAESEEEDSDDDKDKTVGEGYEKKTLNKDDVDNSDSIDSDDNRSARGRGKGIRAIRKLVKNRNNNRDNDNSSSSVSTQKKSGLPMNAQNNTGFSDLTLGKFLRRQDVVAAPNSGLESKMKPAQTKHVLARILPLLQLHSTTTKNEQTLMPDQKSIPDTKSISCNMRNFQLARITCESQEDNLLVKLRKEGANQGTSVLDGDVVVVVSSFTEEMVGDVRPTMRSVSFGEYDGDQSQRHVATALTREILENAINWLLGSTVGEPTSGATFDHYIKYLGEKVPKDMSTANLAEFITSHTWENSQSMRDELDELLNTLIQAGGEGPRNSPLTADFNSAARTHDGYKLQRFIHENLAKETKIVIHLIDGIHRVTALDCALVGFDQNHDGAVGQQYPVDINKYATLLPHKDKGVNMQVYFLPECTTDTDSSTLLKNYQDLSFKIQDYWGKQMPHTFREIIHHEMTHLAKRCEEEKVPYLWECLGILFQTELSSENGRECSQEEKAKLRRGIDVNSTIGSDFVEGLSGRSMEYNLLEKYISCWVERMSVLIIGVLEDSRHMIELGLTFKPQEHASILKELMFQQTIRGNPPRHEYTIFPFRDIGSTLGGKLKGWIDPDRVASAMFDHENKPFSGVISDKRERRVARNTIAIPGLVIILSQILLWSRSCEEDYRKLMQLFSSHNSSYLQIRTGTLVWML